MASTAVTCQNHLCGATIQNPPPRKFVFCPECRSITCTSCSAAHDGISCKDYQKTLPQNCQEAFSGVPYGLSQRREVLRTKASKIIADARQRMKEIAENESQDVVQDSDDIRELIDRLLRVKKDLRKVDDQLLPLLDKERTASECETTEEHLDRISSTVSRLRSVLRRAEARQQTGAQGRKCVETNTESSPDPEGAVPPRTCSDPTDHAREQTTVAETNPDSTASSADGPGGRRTPLSDEQDQVEVEWVVQKPVKCLHEGCGREDYVDITAELFQCPQCQRSSCLKCSAIHESETCEQHQAKLQEHSRDTRTDERTVRAPLPGPVAKTLPDTTGDHHVRAVLPTPRPEDPQHSALKEQLVTCCDEKCHGMAVMDQDEVLFKCPLCSRFSCLRCKVIHENMTCEQYNRSIAGSLAPDQSTSWDSKDVSTGPKEYTIRVQKLVSCYDKKCGRLVLLDEQTKQFECPSCKCNNCLACDATHPSYVACYQYRAMLHDIPSRTGSSDALVDTCQIKSFVPNAKTRGDASLYPDISPYSSGQCAAPENTDSAQPAIELHQTGPAAEASGEIREVMVYCKYPYCKGGGLIDKELERQYECPVCKRISCLDCDAIHREDTCPRYKNMGIVDGIRDLFKCTPVKEPASTSHGGNTEESTSGTRRPAEPD